MQDQSSSSKKIILVCGPTAIGKTAVSIAIAKHFQTEIISADSRQVYREMDIGVARPSPEELAIVKHHFINAIPVTRLFGAGDFEKEAIPLAGKLFERHNVLVLCGGTGMYIRAFLEGLDDLPGADEHYRDALKKIQKEKGVTELARMVGESDKAALEMIDVQNPQRLMRALEIMKATGKKYSELMHGKKARRDFEVIKIGLNLERELLYRRINQRVDMMMQNGLEDEVRRLVPYRHENALKTVGYNEMFDYLDGKCSLAEAMDKIKQHTRNYAKRQLTWFKADKEITWFEPTHLAEIITFIESRL